MLDLNKVAILAENKHYRVGDLFNETGLRWAKDIQTVLTEPMFIDTILRDYLLLKRHHADTYIMSRVIADHVERHNYTVPRPDDLVIHMRLGDVVVNSKEHCGNRPLWAKEMYVDLFGGLRPQGFKRVVIATALHFGANEDIDRYHFSEEAKETSFELIRYVEQQCVDAGYAVALHSNQNVDADFAFMASSSHFVVAQSAFSKIVAKCLLSPTAQVYKLRHSS
jgi:hypothetical protein